MNVWQVKAGDGDRDYHDVFLRFGVMLIGPGTEFGDYRKNKDKYNNCDTTLCRTLHQFAEEAAEKDLVVLKRPRGTKWAALAVGKIKSGYSFEPVFSDVEDFELQHCRHVEWRLPSIEKPIPGLGRGGGTFCHVNDPRARDKVEQLWKEGKEQSCDPIPHETEEVTIKELADSLTASGLPREKAKRVVDEIERLQDLAEWYYDREHDVGEHEARTFLVVPLIKSLGWDEKRVRIEWEHRDVVLFDTDYSPSSKPLVIIETKRLWDPLCDDPQQQARGYAESNLTCRQLVVTDGIRYKLFTKPRSCGEWCFSHFMNLRALTRVHPYKADVDGAVSFLSAMIPK